MAGKALETDMVFPGNPVQVQVWPDYRDVLAGLADEGVGHQCMAAHSDLCRPLVGLAWLVGAEWTDIG